MLGIIVRILLAFAGVITSLFIARDALNFQIVQMFVGIILFVIIIGIFAFLPPLSWFIKLFRKSKKHR